MKEKEMINIYVDGSFGFRDKKSKWAFCVVENDSIIFDASGVINDYPFNTSRQVGGECLAVIKALEWCATHNKKATLFTDYTGNIGWVADLFGKKAWKSNKPLTQEYRRLVLLYKDYLAGFVLVKGHSDNKWNNYVDKLAGRAK